jgi:hypothetical protein
MARSLRAKARRLPPGVDGREPTANRHRGQSRSVRGIAMVPAGAAPATDIHLGRRHCRSNDQVDSKTNGAAASRKGCRGPAEPRPVVPRRDVVPCLSRMHPKVHVRFLGEDVLVTAPPYPIDGGVGGRQACKR